jgi:hypothetical protein
MKFGYITGGYNQIKYITIAQQCTQPIGHKTLANNTSAQGEEDLGVTRKCEFGTDKISVSIVGR